jgi:hypothetical protein
LAPFSLKVPLHSSPPDVRPFFPVVHDNPNRTGEVANLIASCECAEWEVVFGRIVDVLKGIGKTMTDMASLLSALTSELGPRAVGAQVRLLLVRKACNTSRSFGPPAVRAHPGSFDSRTGACRETAQHGEAHEGSRLAGVPFVVTRKPTATTDL